MIRWGKMGEYPVLHAGSGEWYNQPHGQRWDMGEDVAELPHPAWHIELEAGIREHSCQGQLIYLDLREMDWLVGQDWGFLAKAGGDLAKAGGELVLVAGKRIEEAGKLLRVPGLRIEANGGMTL